MTLLTDKELADPEYMRAYCDESDRVFSEVVESRESLRRAAKLALDVLETSMYPQSNRLAAIDALRKELTT